MQTIYLVWHVSERGPVGADYFYDLECENYLERAFDSEEKAIAYMEKRANGQKVDKDGLVVINETTSLHGVYGEELYKVVDYLSYGTIELE